jgi:lipid-A-disaccharide synthase
VDKLFCLFPFEERWFRERGVEATYIGHPLAHLVRPTFSSEHFHALHRLHLDRQMVVLLPGSRPGEIARHLPVLLDAVDVLRKRFDVQFVLATHKGFGTHSILRNFKERMAALSIKVIENQTWDSIAHSTVALAASGTVTMEAAVLGTPMVTFYKVNPLSWYGGRHLVKAPFLSMVNLIAERRIVPELIQTDMTPRKLAAATAELLTDVTRTDVMRAELARVRELLTPRHDPLEMVAQILLDDLHASGMSLPQSESPLVQEKIN